MERNVARRILKWGKMKTVQREDFLDDYDFCKQSYRESEDACLLLGSGSSILLWLSLYMSVESFYLLCMRTYTVHCNDSLIKQNNYSGCAITTTLVWERTLVKYTPPQYCASVITVLGKHINSATVNLFKCKPLLQYEPAERCRFYCFIWVIQSSQAMHAGNL